MIICYNRMSKIHLIPMLIVFLLITSASVTAVQFTATVEGNNHNEITLKWTVENEQDVSHYRIDRKMEADNLPRVNYATVPYGEVYEFVDRNVYKSSGQSEPVHYKLFAVMNNNQAIPLAETEASFTTNTVRRTWGNIKSMFQ